MFFTVCLTCGNQLDEKTCPHCHQGTTVFDFSSPANILAMPMPEFQHVDDLLTDIDYVLRKQATQFKREGRMDLAIACLLKANEMFGLSGISWYKKDLLRVVEYLKIDGQFERANREKERLTRKFPSIFSEEYGLASASRAFSRTLSEAKELGTDLLIVTRHGGTCSECAKYQGRVYSISGKDKRFPPLPPQVWEYGGFHPGCNHGFSLFIESTMTSLDGHDPIEYSNRPFVDDRTPEDIRLYETKKREREQEEADRADYDFIRQFLPDIAPKSFGGYRRMKKLNSAKYQEIVKKAAEQGYQI